MGIDGCVMIIDVTCDICGEEGQIDSEGDNAEYIVNADTEFTMTGNDVVCRSCLKEA